MKTTYFWTIKNRDEAGIVFGMKCGVYVTVNEKKVKEFLRFIGFVKAESEVEVHEIKDGFFSCSISVG